MGRFHGGFLIWDELEKSCGRKMCENAKSRIFLGKNRRRYRYRLSGTGTKMHWAIGTGTAQTGTGTGQSGTSTTTSGSPVLTYFCTVKSRIRIPMFRDPKKLIMGVQIRIELSEKRTVPRRLGEFVFGQT